VGGVVQGPAQTTPASASVPAPARENNPSEAVAGVVQGPAVKAPVAQAPVAVAGAVQAPAVVAGAVQAPAVVAGAVQAPAVVAGAVQAPAKLPATGFGGTQGDTNLMLWLLLNLTLLAVAASALAWKHKRSARQ